MYGRMNVSFFLPKHMPQNPCRPTITMTVTIFPIQGTSNAQNASINIIDICMNMQTICEIMCAIKISVVVTPGKNNIKLSADNLD
jgi:hypothetical protein